MSIERTWLIRAKNKNPGAPYNIRMTGSNEALPVTRERFLEIDLLRTVGIVLMFVYHIGFDLSFFIQFPIDPLSGGWFLLQRITANIFLVLVGVGAAISSARMDQRGAGLREKFRKSLRNGIGLLACGELVSLVTIIAVKDLYVRFGILHLIGVAIILVPLLTPLREGNAILAIVVLLLSRTLGDLSVQTSLLLPLGLTPPSFSSVDYFPLFPWIASVLIGIAIGNFLYNRGTLRRHLPTNRLTTLLSSPGRHSLLIYLVHQPVLLAVLKTLALLRIL